MKLFTAKQNEELQSKLEAAEKENEELGQQLTAAQEEFKTLSEANASLQKDLSEAQTKIDEHESIVSAKDKEIEELKEKSELTSVKVSEQAANLLAAQGHPEPLQVEAEQSEPDVLKIMGNLTGAERTKFYNENKEAIRKAQRSLK